jgi:hypothetical protein
MWKTAGRAPSLRVLPWHLPYNRGKSTENLIQAKKNLNQLRKTSVRVQYTYYQNTHTNIHITKPTHTHTRTHTHITKQYKTTTVQIKTNTV